MRLRFANSIFVLIFLHLFLLSFVSAIDIGALVDQGLANENQEISTATSNLSDSDIGTYLEQAYGELGLNDTEKESLNSLIMGSLNSTNTTQNSVSSLDNNQKILIQTNYSKTVNRTAETLEKIKKLQAQKKINAKVYTRSQDRSFLDKLIGLLDKLKKSTGFVIRSTSYSDSDLPSLPTAPGSTQEVMKPDFSFSKIFRSLTGFAIIGVPKWSFDGSKGGDFVWKEEHSSQAAAYTHFELSISANMSVKDAVNGIVYNQGYYLNDKTQKWIPFNFEGTQVGNTGWLRENGKASLTLSNFTNTDYGIFLAYSCLKIVNSEWKCNDGKWAIFVVGIGNTSYNQNAGEVPSMEYTEIKDLDIKNVASILTQLNVNVTDFQPRLDDSLIVSSKQKIEATVGSEEELQFVVLNLGNKKIENISYEFDVGENSIAQVVSVDLPSNIDVGTAVPGKIKLLFKSSGNYNFPLYIRSTKYEVDSSDNGLTFNAAVSPAIDAPIGEVQTDATGAVRQVNYVVKEPYNVVTQNDGSGAQLSIISGTDKIRTVFGGYFAGTSINPTLEVYFRPVLAQEAVTNTPYMATFSAGGKMLTGDREAVQYYISIVNTKNGKSYRTQDLESGYSYNFNPKDLVPDFELCTLYNVKVNLVGSNAETIDVMQPKPMSACPDKTFFTEINATRIQKIDGDYVLISGGKLDNYLYQNGSIDYTITFSRNNVRYTTPTIYGAKGAALFPLFGNSSLFPSQSINYAVGETWDMKVNVVKINYDKVAAGVSFENGFQWNGWQATQRIVTRGLILKDEKAYSPQMWMKIVSEGGFIKSNGYPGPWETKMSLYVDIMNYKASYISNELAIKTINSSSFRLSLYDLTENNYAYDVEMNFSDIYKYIAKDYPRMTPEMAGYISSWAVSANYIIPTTLQMRPLPALANGHIYEVRFSIGGPNASLFTPIKSRRVIYIDPLQFIGNNPILRTQFAYLHNAPGSMVINSQTTESPYVPSILIDYFPKNTYLDHSTGIIDVMNSSQINARVLPVDQMAPMIYYYTGKNYDYIFTNETQRAPAGLSIEVIPLSTNNPQEKEQFNCKIGKYSGVCYRDARGLQVNYLDRDNGFLYRITLTDPDEVFLKKYRDNSQFYDSIVYDILSEIELSPILDFATPDKIAPLKVYNGGLIIDQSEARFAYQLYKMFVYAKTNPLTDIIGGTIGNMPSGTKVNSITFTDVENGNVISMDLSSRTSYPWRDIVESAGLTEGHTYKLRYPVEGGVSFTTRYTYIKNYNSIYQFVKSDLKKVVSLNSMLMGPSICMAGDGAPSLGYPCYVGTGRVPIYSGKETNSKNFEYPQSPQSYEDISAASTSEVNFVVNPNGISKFDDNEDTSQAEFNRDVSPEAYTSSTGNTKYYRFVRVKYKDIYAYYRNAPINYNTYDAAASGIVCTSYKEVYKNSPSDGGDFGAKLTLVCSWSNIDKMEVYRNSLVQIYPGKTVFDLNNMDAATAADFKNNYANIVLNKYLEWYPATPVANSSFFSA